MFQKFTLTIIVIIASFSAFAQTGQVGIGTATPEPSALLDLSATDKGLLIPRMSLSDRGNLVTPATSLLIYQYDNTPGFYYNSGTPFLPNWQMLSTGAVVTPPPPAALNIVSSSMTGDNLLTSTSFASLPGASISFTPTTTSTYISFTASGFGYTGSNTIVEFQVLVNGVAVGGAEEKVGVYSQSNVVTSSSTPWSAAFSKKVNVNANVSNTVLVQYRVTAINGTVGMAIYNTTAPANHATLTAFVQ